MLVNPIFALNELGHLQSLGVYSPPLFVEEVALITSPFQVAANRLREIARNKGRHGSCGMGIGETTSDFLKHGTDVLFVRDIRDPKTLKEKLLASRRWKREDTIDFLASVPRTPLAQQELNILEDDRVIDDCLEKYKHFTQIAAIVDESYLVDRLHAGVAVFEGAQGVLLDQKYGFQPHTTWTDTTFGNAVKLLGDFDGTVQRIGVLRVYAIRHGAGPFVTEDPTVVLKDDFNIWGEWQQTFRVGHFDAVAARYALKVIGGVGSLALTHLDRMSYPARICVAYNYKDTVTRDIELNEPVTFGKQADLTIRLLNSKPIYESYANEEAFLAGIEKELGVPLSLLSYGPTADQVRLP
jgi:adenylosuccinate synthase